MTYAVAKLKQLAGNLMHGSLALLVVGLAGAAESPAPTVTPKVEEVYTLVPQDKLTFAIEEDPVKGNDPDVLSVNALGELSFRISRGSDISITVLAKGKTLALVKQELKSKLDADYYENSKIKLDLKEQAPRAQKSGQVLFIGKGSRGNVLQLPPGDEKRIFESVFQVGVTEYANLKKVKLTRVVDKASQKTETKIIDLEAIRKGDRSNNVILQDGDIVEVPEKGIVFN